MSIQKIPHKLLIIQSASPFAQASAQEALDLTLAAAAFDLSVSLLMTGDACYQLTQGLNAEVVNRKPLNKMLKALPIYGVESIMVEQEALQHRNLENSLDSALPIRPMNAADIKTLIQTADTVLRF